MIADNSALTPALDKPEQALDLIRDAISSAGYSYEDDVAVVINCAIKDIYDKVWSIAEQTYIHVLGYNIDLCIFGNICSLLRSLQLKLPQILKHSMCP